LSTPDLHLWLVRHGETPASRDGVLAGWTNVPLTDTGQEQARALRPLLATETFTSVWSSDLDRTMTTARLAYGDAATDPRLREIHFGDLEGLAWREIESHHQESLLAFEGFAAPGGESLVDLRTRVLGFLADLPPGRHLLFTHGVVIALLGREVGQRELIPTGTLRVIDWTNRRPLPPPSPGLFTKTT
jgi:2,3-bisphosphoglycerate-dependent phosphoglycerate mutase